MIFSSPVISAFARLCDSAFIILPRQQPQGKAHHAAGMAEHPFHGEIGLARMAAPLAGGAMIS